LQEYIIMNRVMDLINPDIVVLQFCNNDFENNSFAMEQRSIVLSQTIRPYLQDGRIVFRYSRYNPYALLLHHSLVFAFIDSRIQMLRFRLNKGYAPEPTADVYQESVDLTGKIFQMIKKRLKPGTQLLVFNANSKFEGKQYSDLEKLAGEHGFIMLPDFANGVFESQKKGIQVRAADGGHWSELGHDIIGRDLVDYIAHFIQK